MTQQQHIGSTKPLGKTPAAPPVGRPKVLRVGLVRGGKIPIEERVVKRSTGVTIGRSKENTFVVPSKAIPPSFEVFELRGGDYLNFVDGMTGRIARTAGSSNLAGLKAQAKRVPKGDVQAYQVPLGEEVRGKVVLGESTLLFHFVAPARVEPQARLPVVGLGGDVDWTTTIIAAFSFLFHFGLVGSIYSDWMDPNVDDDASVSQLIESVKQLPPPPPIEQPKETGATASSAAAAADAPKAAAPGAKGAGSSKAASDARAAAISGALAQLDLVMVGALSSRGGATNNVLDSGSTPTGLLDGAAANGAGAGAGGPAGLNLGSAGGGALRPGAGGGGGLAGLAEREGGSGNNNVGTTVKVKGPVGNASIGGAAVSGGNIANASAVVAGMQAGFRRCYNRGLSEDPNMKGTVRVTAKIGPNGDVLSATPSGSGLSGTVMGCVAARVQSAQFAPPEGGGATIVIPVTFVSQ